MSATDPHQHAAAESPLYFARIDCTTESSQPRHSSVPIICLHGLASSHLEYTRAAPYLSDAYDLILVDLPGHSRSKQSPFSFENAVAAIAELIRNNVTAGKAHIVGLSLGGFVALQFARKHPELVASVFGTGCAPYTGFKHWFITRPRLLSCLEVVSSKVITDDIAWAVVGVEPFPELRVEQRANQNMALLSAGYRAAGMASLQELAEVRGVRIAIVAGGKQDGVEDARRAGKVLVRSNTDCKAFVVRKAIHWWNLQYPELFAQGVRAWIEGIQLPAEFEELP